MCFNSAWPRLMCLSYVVFELKITHSHSERVTRRGTWQTCSPPTSQLGMFPQGFFSSQISFSCNSLSLSGESRGPLGICLVDTATQRWGFHPKEGPVHPQLTHSSPPECSSVPPPTARVPVVLSGTCPEAAGPLSSPETPLHSDLPSA